jgi:hypothetical protein
VKFAKYFDTHAFLSRVLSFLFNFRESQLIINGTKSSFAPIGVFDSGVGGLTVLRALREHLPYEDFIYLGDTARLPYGTKSAESIVRYSLLAASRLVRYNIKCLVVACNTASAVAIDTLRVQLAPLPVIGVVDPGADAGIVASASGRIAIIATESTVRGEPFFPDGRMRGQLPGPVRYSSRSPRKGGRPARSFPPSLIGISTTCLPSQSHRIR